MEEEFLIGHLSSSSSDSTSGEEALDALIFNEFYLNNVGIKRWVFFNLKAANDFFF